MQRIKNLKLTTAIVIVLTLAVTVIVAILRGGIQ